MKIRISRVSGFCMGVRIAIDNVLEAANRPRGAIFVDGPVIHNPQVISLLENKGVQALAPDTRLTAADTVIIRAHGVPPEREAQFRAAGCRVINATCPLVARIQKIIERERGQGWHIVIVGEQGHPEVIGLEGYAGTDGTIIESAADLDRIPAGRPLALVAQSTQDIDEFETIAARVRERFPSAVVHDTICRATRERQEAVKELAATCDAVIVVGGQQSGNTKRLVQIAGRSVPTFHVETAGEIDEAAVAGFAAVGIAGGASTPNWMIIAVKERLARIAERHDPVLLRPAKRLAGFLINSNLVTAAAGAGLAWAYYGVANPGRPALCTLIAFLYIFAMHTLNRFTKYGAYRFNSPLRASFFESTKAIFLTAGIAALAGAAVAAASISHRHLGILALCSLPGALYPLPLVPARLARVIPFRSLREIPGSKDIVIGLGWAFIIVLLPALGTAGTFTAAHLGAFTFIFLLVAARSVLYDILDIPGDRITGNDTIPILLGFQRTRRLLFTMLALAAVMLAAGLAFGTVGRPALVFTLTITALGLLAAACTERTAYHSTLYEGLTDLSFILTGAAALALP
ncbi:MAG: 4-hydroxy-3-methylbut-2-enyl diphosphate reductase [Planctomycetota bacterium]